MIQHILLKHDPDEIFWIVKHVIVRILWIVNAWDLKLDYVGSNLISISYHLCDLDKQVNFPVAKLLHLTHLERGWWQLYYLPMRAVGKYKYSIIKAVREYIFEPNKHPIGLTNFCDCFLFPVSISIE